MLTKWNRTTILIVGGGGGVAKLLQYYIGVVRQMITVHHESWVATLEISFPET